MISVAVFSAVLESRNCTLKFSYDLNDCNWSKAL